MSRYKQPLVPRGRTGSRSLSAIILAATAASGGSPPVADAAPVNAAAATLTTSLTGDNNDLTFTARVKGTLGNAITITYVDPGEDAEEEVVEVIDGTNIVVTLRKAESVLSTATQVKDAIEADPDANALVSIENAAGNNGSGSVTELAETSLALGVDGTAAPAGTQLYYGGRIYFTPVDNTANDSNWVRSAEFTSF